MARWRVLFALALVPGCGLVNYDVVALSDGGAGAESDGTAVDEDGGPIDGSLPTGDCSGAVTGSYVGDGSAGRQFDVGFQPVLVIVHSEVDQSPMIRMATMPSDIGKQAVGMVPAETGVLVEAPDGFAVGNDVRVNEAGGNYYYAAFPSSANIATGQYLGNGGTQSITGVGFQPDWLLVTDRGDGVVVSRFANAQDHTYRLEGNNGVPDGVTSFDVDGFSLGNRPYSNRDGRTFNYVAWQNEPGGIVAGSYLGDGVSDRLIAIGFRPEYVLIRGEADVAAVHRYASHAGNDSITFDTATEPNAITALLSDGFEVGTNARSNDPGIEYSYLGLSSCGTR